MKSFTKRIIQTQFLCEYCGKTSTSQKTIEKHEPQCTRTIESIIHHDGKYTIPTIYSDSFEFLRFCNVRNYGEVNYHLWLNIDRQFTIGESKHHNWVNNNYAASCDAHNKLIVFKNKYFAYSDDETQFENTIYIKPSSLKNCSVIVTFKNDKTIEYSHTQYNRNHSYDKRFPINLTKNNPIVRVDIIDKPVQIKKKVKNITLNLTAPKHSVYNASHKKLLIPATSNYSVDIDLAKYWLKNTMADKSKLPKVISITERRASSNVDDYLQISDLQITHFQGSRPITTIMGLITINGDTKKSALLTNAIKNSKMESLDDKIITIGEVSLKLSNKSYSYNIDDKSIDFKNVVDDKIVSFDEVYDMICNNNNVISYNKYSTSNK